ncbi:MAG: hypothetical protein V3S33_02265 [Gammaproteobacteria bacterium]
MSKPDPVLQAAVTAAKTLLRLHDISQSGMPRWAEENAAEGADRYERELDRRYLRSIGDHPPLLIGRRLWPEA